MTKDDQRELFIVVDKNDQILGHRTRFECHHDKSLIHRAGGVVIYNQKGEILLQKRSQYKDLNPGFFTISCSGHIGKGETYQKAVSRELKEELGVETKIKFIKKFLVYSPGETEMFSLFEARHSGPFKPNPDEVEKVDFFSKEKIRELFKRDELPLTTCAKESLRRIQVL